MHETTTRTATPVETAVMAAINTVPARLRAQALTQYAIAVTVAALYVGAADYDHDRMEDLHERASYWACTARERGASEHEITAARQEGEHAAEQQPN